MSTRRARIGEAVADHLIQPPCEENAGQHMCVLHPDEYPRTNWEMNDHVAKSGEHVEVWMCPLHGPESTHPDEQINPMTAKEMRAEDAHRARETRGIQ